MFQVVGEARALNAESCAQHSDGHEIRQNQTVSAEAKDKEVTKVQSRPVIIDTDPGQDDAFAILLALASPALEVLGLTTVAGNMGLAQTTDNARRIVELAGHTDIPVYAGADRPMMRQPRPVPEIHGDTGIDGWDWEEARRGPEAASAVDFLVRTLRAHPSPVTLIVLGPQTNIALALSVAPDIKRNIERIVFMGGGFFEGGNMTPAAEYNILVDPEAARIVLKSGLPITAVPLDCTHATASPVHWSHQLAAHDGEVMQACAGMMEFFEIYGNKKYGTASRPLHDAVAVAALLWPELFEGKLCPVDVECAGELTTGMTVVDWLRQTGRPDNCLWLNGCTDPAEVYRRMEAALATLAA
ncbi:nucleoside hydrolase [Salipiger sp. 1_MG-2023]|uniref:nucleoside hydrolase n=1 Tax=Salipiger sp. 1_MG-2023 TaxID=3062665 RepID=UPI0026E259BD|nr:nucleoside hydrolase [Salipiger sp. 1_MG-2023]MDO6588425.1 nucleoside hydrolase [Salipiger sp. 1_MG-2023]